ncbi:MAG: hypothetical protein H7Y38_06065 [Armatimonadetes bacterium]|nr:hypothetical protein [Armatimonadota bacterium]
MRLLSFWLLLIVPGTGCFAICLYYAVQDWTMLQRAYADFERMAGRETSLAILFVAEAKQNIHRINLFADGVWALLGAIVAAIGLHGVCTMPTKKHLP